MFEEAGIAVSDAVKLRMYIVFKDCALRGCVRMAQPAASVPSVPFTLSDPTAAQHPFFPLFYACHINIKQLQAVFPFRPADLCAPPRALLGVDIGRGLHSNDRQSLVAGGGLCVLLARRLMIIYSKHAVKHPLKHAACILPLPHGFDLLYSSHVTQHLSPPALLPHSFFIFCS